MGWTCRSLPWADALDCPVVGHLSFTNAPVLEAAIVGARGWLGWSSAIPLPARAAGPVIIDLLGQIVGRLRRAHP
jgi:hypothetical protein